MRLDAPRSEPFDSALEQIAAEFDWLDRRLAAHVAALRRSGRFNEDPLRGLYVGEEEAQALLVSEDDADCDAQTLMLQRKVLDARAERSPALPLCRIARACGLDPLERAALLVAAAPALDRRYATLFAFAQNDVGRRIATPELMLALLAEDRAERLAGLTRFAPGAPLVRHGLLVSPDAERGRPLADRGFGVDDRVAAALLGDGAIDSRIADGAMNLPEDLPVDPALLAAVEAALDGGAHCLLFEAAADCGQHAAARAACAARGLGLLLAEGDGEMTAGAGERAMLIAREARLGGMGLFVGIGPGASSLRLDRLAAALSDPPLPLFVTARPGSVDTATIAARADLAIIRLAKAPVQQRVLWWAPAGSAAERLAQSTRLGPVAIARTLARRPADLIGAASLHAGSRLPAIARRVDPMWRWEDLLLPDRQRRQLEELAATQRHWPRVIGEWGFAASTPCPQNVVALFSGPSGTGKTMAASLIAAGAGMPLYRVDLAAIFDKYIGETEKQLDRLFDAADEAGAALLFDEADALFGKRTETRDAHDRYANISTAYLLQRIEAHDGLVVLTSNLAGNMDDAFARRLAMTVAFPLPGIAERRQLWRRAFPAAAPLDADLDLDAIAEIFDLSGGNIRNAAIAAAYRAAADDGAIGLRHVIGAIGRELEKQGRAPIAADFGGLADDP
ncbi:ATP-binding protein [Flavisphingomonas formosensis]|uniref:ATP-binding protein n=1 Tax=Flavisphingomonas formosensis TaxID=861534 RepID=UPI0012FBB741|nr:ATP-binding protein [Sphingomonas formosensis]